VVVDRVLPDAPDRTTAQLRRRIRRLIMAADPDAAARRYQDAVTRRRFEHGAEPDGTALLAGRWLPADRAAAAAARIRAIADWIKHAGDPRSLDQIRADTLLDLIQGLPVPGPDGQDHRLLPGDPHAAEDAEPGEDAEDGEDVGEPPARAARRRGCPTCGTSRLSRGLELAAPATTLLGLAQHPGQLGSWGPVIAEVARNLIADLLTAPWRISLTDDDGRVIWHGPIRTRPKLEDLRRRHPTRRQAAYIRARDRRCRHPGCSRPAACAQIDPHRRLRRRRRNRRVQPGMPVRAPPPAQDPRAVAGPARHR